MASKQLNPDVVNQKIVGISRLCKSATYGGPETCLVLSNGVRIFPLTLKGSNWKMALFDKEVKDIVIGNIINDYAPESIGDMPAVIFTSDPSKTSNFIIFEAERFHNTQPERKKIIVSDPAIKSIDVQDIRTEDVKEVKNVKRIYHKNGPLLGLQISLPPGVSPDDVFVKHFYRIYISQPKIEARSIDLGSISVDTGSISIRTDPGEREIGIIGTEGDGRFPLIGIGDGNEIYSIDVEI